MTRPQVVGLSVHALPDETTLVVAPGGEQLLVRAAAADIVSLLRRCDGNVSGEQLAASTPNAAATQTLIDALTQAGCLTRAEAIPDAADWARFAGPPSTPGRPATASVVLLSDHALTQTILRCAGRGGLRAPDRVDVAALGDHLAACRVDLVLCALAAPDHDRLLAINDICTAARVPWASFHLDHGTGWLGPLIIPGATADYHDLLERRRCLADDPESGPRTAPRRCGPAPTCRQPANWTGCSRP